MVDAIPGRMRMRMTAGLASGLLLSIGSGLAAPTEPLEHRSSPRWRFGLVSAESVEHHFRLLAVAKADGRSNAGARRLGVNFALASLETVPIGAAEAGSAGALPARYFEMLSQVDREKKEQLATAAVFLLVLVVLAGAALLLLVILWGRRVRRGTRKPTGRTSPGDELWYLKPSGRDAKTEPPEPPEKE